VRGGRLARDEDLFISGADVTDFERSAVEHERTSSLWQQSKDLKLILLTCCVAAIAQGWDQGSLTGANLTWPGDFGLDTDVSRRARWIFGGVNAIAYFATSSAGAWLSDPLNEYFYGRRGALFVARLFSFVGVVGSAFCNNWQALFGCRLLVGIGMGAKASVVPILESEVAPARIRGRLLVSWQTFTALGIFLGNAANVILNRSWRWQTGCAFIPALILLILVFVCSESPRWLIKRGNYRKAYEVLVRLREHPLLAARDLYYIHAQIQVEASLFAKRKNVDLGLQEWAVNINRNMYQVSGSVGILIRSC
jgi:MFS family permease